jgi:hypothetical protein
LIGRANGVKDKNEKVEKEKERKSGEVRRGFLFGDWRVTWDGLF